MSELTEFDHYFNDDGPAALVIREHLMPVEGVSRRVQYQHLW